MRQLDCINVKFILYPFAQRERERDREREKESGAVQHGLLGCSLIKSDEESQNEPTESMDAARLLSYVITQCYTTDRFFFS